MTCCCPSCMAECRDEVLWLRDPSVRHALDSILTRVREAPDEETARRREIAAQLRSHELPYWRQHG